mgnify:CR=1 FL=1
MKKFIKYLSGFIYCLLFRVKYQKGVYIGIGSKLVGGQIYILLKVRRLCHRQCLSLCVVVK